MKDAEHSTPLVPLRDTSAKDDPNLELGAQLLRHVPPLSVSNARRHRVWLALPVRRNGFFRRWSGATRLAVAFAFIATAASAGFGVKRYLGERPVEEATQPEQDVTQSAVRSPRARSAEEPSEPEVEPAVTVERTTPPTKTRVPKPPVAKRATAQSSSTAEDDPETQLMLEAMRARKAGDSERAAKLLREYRTKHPDGLLQEEAFALSIEAARARGDDSAKTLAQQYLRRFPDGRFRKQAERVVRTGSR